MPTTILRAPGFSHFTSIGSLHFKDVLFKDRKADQFGSIFIQQNKGAVILASAKASLQNYFQKYYTCGDLSIRLYKKLSPSLHFENERTF